MFRKTLFKIAFYALVGLIAAFALIPFLWAIATSFKTEAAIYSTSTSFIPRPFTFANYIEILNNSAMVSYFMNTVVVSVATTIVSLVIAVLGAYGFSRFKFPGHGTLLMSILFTRMLPRVALLVPFYVTLTGMGMINTKTGLVLVYVIIGMPVAIWLLKGFIDALPYEVEEAAIVDGCGPLGVLFRVVIPQLAPALAAVGMYTFILAWNEFLFPLMIAKDSSTRPISVALAFFIDEVSVKWGPMMAASVMMSIPAIIVFSFAQKYIVKGLSDGAVKG